MKRICAGYRKHTGEVVKCGKYMGEAEGPKEDVTHGTCDECFKHFLEELENWNKLK